MTFNSNNAQSKVLVAIDIAKAQNDVLVLLPTGIRKKFLDNEIVFFASKTGNTYLKYHNPRNGKHKSFHGI